MTTTLIERDPNQFYSSEDGKTVMERDGFPRHSWVLRVDGVEIDRDQYRRNLAEEYDLDLQDMERH